MADEHGAILVELRDVATTCAVIADRTERIQEQVAGVIRRDRQHGEKIASLEATTVAQEKGLDELKAKARGAGRSAGAVSGGAVSAMVAAALRMLWPTS